MVPERQRSDEPTDIAPPRSARSAGRSIQLAIYVIGAILIILAAMTTPEFASLDNILVVLRASSLIGMVACAVSLITISGNFFSLSSGAIAVAAGVIVVQLTNAGMSLAIALPLTLAIGAALSVAQAVPIAMGANPIVTTLAAGLILSSLAEWMTVGVQQSMSSDAGVFLGSGRPLGVPVQIYFLVATAIVLSWIVYKTRFGRQVSLHGSNRETAVAVGIRPATIAIATFAVAGLAAAFVGMLAAFQNRISDVTGFGSFDLSVLAAIVIGGIAIEGGRGAPWRALVGAVLIAALQNYLAIRGFSPAVQQALAGLVIIVGISIFAITRTRKT